MNSGESWDIVVVGSANIDYLIRSTRMPRAGETVKGQQFMEAPGGKGANQAVAAARLGARTALVARIGTGPNGDMLLEKLLLEGVHSAYIIRDETEETGVALIVVDQKGEKQITIYPGANGLLTVEDILAARSAIQGSRVLLTQLEIPIDIVTAAARLAREAGVKVVLDPAPAAPLPDELLELVDVIRPNKTEAEILTGIEVHNRVSARSAATKLMNRGVGAVAVQAGDEGNLLIWKEGELWLPKIRIESIDATGAGDSFAAALGVALAEGQSLQDAGPFANAAAALATTVFGAQAGLPSRDAVMEMLASLA